MCCLRNDSISFVSCFTDSADCWDKETQLFSNLVQPQVLARFSSSVMCCGSRCVCNWHVMMILQAPAAENNGHRKTHRHKNATRACTPPEARIHLGLRICFGVNWKEGAGIALFACALRCSFVDVCQCSGLSMDARISMIICVRLLYVHAIVWHNFDTSRIEMFTLTCSMSLKIKVQETDL